MSCVETGAKCLEKRMDEARTSRLLNGKAAGLLPSFSGGYPPPASFAGSGLGAVAGDAAAGGLVVGEGPPATSDDPPFVEDAEEDRGQDPQQRRRFFDHPPANGGERVRQKNASSSLGAPGVKLGVGGPWCCGTAGGPIAVGLR